MAADKYLSLISGKEQEVSAVQTGGAGSAGKIVALDDTTGLLDETMMPSGIGPDTVAVTATEALTAGDLVNLYNSSGLKCKKANAATGTALEAHGFVLAGVQQSATATVYLSGQNTQVTSLTPGATYWLSKDTAGGITATPPSAGGAGTLSQQVGVATGATSLQFNPQRAIIMAA